MNIEGNWSFITVRFHETDLVTFDHFTKMILIPYILTNEYYVIGIEHPSTSERHLHAVLKNTTSRDNDKVRQKVNNLVKSKKNNIWNTIQANAVDCKSLKTTLDIYSTIGYICKQSGTDIQTNIPEKEIEAGRTAFYHESKTPVAQVDNVIEYKNIQKGNLLLYLYDAHIKYPNIKLRLLPSYMVKFMNVSFGLCYKQLNYYLMELKLKLGGDENRILLNDEIDLSEPSGSGLNPDDCSYHHEYNDKMKDLLQKIEILEIKNKILQDELLSVKLQLKKQKNQK